MPVCPHCGENNPDRARFCLACGTALPDAGVPPAQIRKNVTVVFTDLIGSTAIGDQLDPETLRRVMGRYFEAMRSVVERHGGTVEKFIGDAVMAVFGVPELHEDDALRAVRAAAEMRESLDRLNEGLEREVGIRIRARTGVNTGEVVTGDPSAGQSLVVGDAVNVAARLEQAAAPDEILIGAPTRRLVRDAVVVEPTEPLPLRGKREPVPAFRLLGVRPGAPAYARRMDSPMVGREGERTLLWQAFERSARDRSCHLFTILGSAGVGKSRLAAELTAATADRATVLSGRCLPYGDGITYWPVVEMIRQAVRIGDDTPLEELGGRIREVLPDEADAELISVRLTPLFGAAGETTATEETSWAVRRFLEALAADRPVVVVFDDIHWGEPTFLDLVEYLAEWSRDAPLLLVCLARPELLDLRPAWGGGKLNATSIHLEPLTEGESANLIDNLLGRAELAEEARSRIAEAAEGNPLFVEEMVGMLIDDGLLRRDDGHWVPTRDLSSLAVPPTIQALLDARLDRLAPEERAVIERASVEGKVFHHLAVEELSPAPARAQVASHLQTLIRKELVRPGRSEFGGLEAFAFRHLLVRDAAYRGMPKDTRADLHARFADWLLAVAGDRITEYEEIAGYHLEQAYRYREELGPLDEEARAVGRRAADRLGSAGRRAVARGDAPAAAKLLGRASSLLPARAPERLALLLTMGEALGDIGDFEHAGQAVAEVVEAARDAGDRRLEWLAMAQEAELRINGDPSGGSLQEVRAVARNALEFFQQADDAAGLAKTWHLFGLLEWIEARAAATEQALERAVEFARRAGDRRQEAEDLSLLTMTAAWGPTPATEGIRRVDGILERSGGHGQVEAHALITRAQLEALLGRFEEARSHAVQGRRILQELGLRLYHAATSHAEGTVELLAGDAQRAERVFREGYDELERMGETAYLSTSAGMIADALYRQGRLEEAERFTRISEEAADPLDLASQIQWRMIRAKVLATTGRGQEAEAMARDAVTIAEGTDFHDTTAEALLALAEVVGRSGRVRDAVPLVERAIELNDRKENAVAAEAAREMLARIRP